MTIREFFQAQQDQSGRAMLARTCWIDEHRGFLRLNTPNGVHIVSPEDDLAHLCEVLDIASDSGVEVANVAEDLPNPAPEGDPSRTEVTTDSSVSRIDRGMTTSSRQWMQVPWIAAVPALAVAYYFGIALPSNNAARLAFEQQKYADEQKKQGAETTRAREEAASRQLLLDTCFEAANSTYWAYVKLNGTELKDGKVSATANVWSTADKRKNDERDVCLKRYPSR